MNPVDRRDGFAEMTSNRSYHLFMIKRGICMSMLQNKVCVITGGAGSIGLASAKLFLEHGAKVLLVDLNGDALSAAVRRLGPERADWIVADVSQPEAVQAYCARAVERFGKIDVLFSNAGNPGVIAPRTCTA